MVNYVTYLHKLDTTKIYTEISVDYVKTSHIPKREIKKQLLLVSAHAQEVVDLAPGW